MDQEHYRSPSELQMKSAVHRNDRRFKRRSPIWPWLVLALMAAMGVIGIVIAVKQ